MIKNNKKVVIGVSILFLGIGLNNPTDTIIWMVHIYESYEMGIYINLEK